MELRRKQPAPTTRSPSPCTPGRARPRRPSRRCRTCAGAEARRRGATGARAASCPGDGQPIAAQVVGLAQEKGWQVIGLQTDDGRLDDVFRDLTITEDVSKDAQKED